MSDLVSQAEFARIVGCSRQYVSKMVKKGVIKLSSGKVDVEPAKEALRKHRDYAKPSKVDLVPDKPIDSMTVEELRALRRSLSDDQPDEGASPSDDRQFYRAKIAKENARLKELKRMEEEGRLVDARAVAHDFADMFSVLRQSFRTMPDRLAGRLYSAESPREIRDILRDEVHDCLSDIADRLEEMADDDEPELQAAE